MEIVIFITFVVVVAIILTIYHRVQHIKKLKANILSSFGNIPLERDLNMDSIRQYARRIDHHDLRIDSITWNDIDMDNVYKRINACLSSIGQEYLYNCLHQLHFDEKELLEREQLIKFFENNPKERFEAQIALAKLGESNNNGIASLIFGSGITLLRKHYIYNILAIMPLVFAVFLVFSVPVGVLGLILSFSINVIVYYRAMRLINIEIPSIAYFASMMNCCKRLYKIESLNTLDIMNKLQKPFSTFKKVITKAPSSRPGGSADLAEMFWIYFSIMFLYDIRHYNNFMKMVTEHNQDFHHIYRTIGEIDLALSILSFRLSLPTFSTPEFSDENELYFEDIFHPLILDPISNTHKIDKGNLITGSNASGKSTFIKALAINSILAQTIFTCTAKRFKTRFAMTVTSMAMRDDLLEGESYFIVEIKSLKRILDLVKKYPCICYIDEILRGTNTIERIAASASILEYLNKQNCLCIAASHDIELTRISGYRNYHFCEQVTDGGITFDYTLKEGPSITRNAIKLLEIMEFDDEIVLRAEELAREKG